MKQKIPILLVDDDSNFLESVKQVLMVKSNYHFDLAFSAEEAIEKIGQKNYETLVCDIQMPGLDGFQFLKYLREKGKNIPFIVFTVTDNKETVLKAYRLGANGFVGKYGKTEVVFSTLIKSIDNAVKK
jgi:DNA-binding NarL/FixJ family response regulator